MNKKGQGLPLNTLVMAIIVIIVLVIIVIFFLGGFSAIKDRFTSIFSKAPGGEDYDLVVNSCMQYCEQAKLLASDISKKNSAYCSKTFRIDKNGNGKIDIEEGEREDNFKCFDDYIGVSCEGVSCT